MTRARRRMALYGLAAAAAFALIGLLGQLQFRASVSHAAERELAVVAESTAEQLFSLLERLDSALRSLRRLPVAGCGEAVLRELRAIPYEIEGVREAGVFTDGALRCTSWGPTRPPVALHPGDGTVEPDRLVLRSIAGSAFGFQGRNILVNLGLPGAGQGNGVNALIEVEHLAIFARPATARGIALEIGIPGGDTLASFGPPESGAEGQYVRRYRERQGGPPLRVEARMDHATARQLAADLRHGTQSAGLVLGALAAGGILLLGRRRAGLLAEVDLAARRGEFYFAYQPIFDLRSGRVSAVETLLRWRHPDHGVIAPERFVGYCEDSRKLNAICIGLLPRLAAELEPLLVLDPEFTINLNVSSSQLDLEALGALADALEAAGLPMDRMVFEVTERRLLEQDQAAEEHIFEEEFALIRSRGAQVAIDDFGTGYCGMAYLKLFPFDIVKVDRMFLQCPPDPQRSRLLGESLIHMVQHLGLEGVAEGVETERQLQLLQELGVRYAQGFLLAPPLDAGSLRRLMQSPDPLAAHRAPEGAAPSVD